MTRASNSRVAASRARTILASSPARTQSHGAPQCDGPSNPALTAWPDPRALGVLSEAPLADASTGRRPARAPRGPCPRDRSRRPHRRGWPPVGASSPWGSVALYRPDPAAPLRHRLLEARPAGPHHRRARPRPAGRAPRGLGQPRRRQRGGRAHRRRTASPLGAVRPPRPHGPGRRVDALTLAAAVAWNAVDLIPPVAEPGRLPAGAGAALLNVLAALASRPGPALAPLSRPVPDGAALLEPDRVVSLRPGDADALRAIPRGCRGNVRPGRVRGGAGRLAPRAPRAAHPPGWARGPAPGRRRAHDWQGRTYHRRECQGLRRREHRVVRVVEGNAGAHATSPPSRPSAASRGPPHAGRTRGPAGAPLARGRSARSSSLPLAAMARGVGSAAASRGDTTPRGSHRGGLAGNRTSGGDRFRAISSTRAGRRFVLSPKLARAYRSRHGALGVGARRTLGQQLVREVLGLIGPAVRAAATAWLEAMPATRQEAELDGGRPPRARVAAGPSGLLEPSSGARPPPGRPRAGARDYRSEGY